MGVTSTELRMDDRGYKGIGKKEPPSTAEKRYISLRSKLTRVVGIRLARKIVKLIRHFYSAPELQITAYVVTILREEGVHDSLHKLINKLVQHKAFEGPETCHSLAKEIAQKQYAYPIPSYCMSSNCSICLTCGGFLIS